MTLQYRISINPSERDRAVLQSLGLILKAGFQTVVISEKHESANHIILYCNSNDIPAIPFTTFTDEEISCAKACLVFADWVVGYPMPEDEYPKNAYDTSDSCGNCGIGKIPKSNLWISTTPNWKSRSVAHVNWLYDILLCTASVREDLSKYGYSFDNVYCGKTRKLSEEVFKINLPISNIPFATECLKPLRCPKCARTKYDTFRAGFHPRLNGELNAPIMLSQEFFGTDQQAQRRILVNAELISIARLKGWNFEYYAIADCPPHYAYPAGEQR